MSKTCLIIGGYGATGKSIQAILKERQTYDTILLAGRHPERGRNLETRGVHVVYFDAESEKSLELLSRVKPDIINCSDLRTIHLLHEVAKLGLKFVDITLNERYWRLAKHLHGEVQASGGIVLLGGGLIPGLSNVLSRVAFERLGPGARYHTGISLGVFDRYGKAALKHMIDGYLKPEVLRRVQTFHIPGKVPREFYSFPFPDGTYYPETIGAQEVGTWLELTPRFFTTVMRTLKSRRYFLEVIERHQEAAEALVLRLTQTFSFQTHTSLVLNAETDLQRLEAYISANSQVEITALAAVLMLEQLQRSAHSGVFLPEEVLDADALLDELRRQGISVVIKHYFSGLSN